MPSAYTRYISKLLEAVEISLPRDSVCYTTVSSCSAISNLLDAEGDSVNIKELESLDLERVYIISD